MGLYLLETTAVCNSVLQNEDWKCIPSYEYNFQSVDYTFNFLMIRNNFVSKWSNKCNHSKTICSIEIYIKSVVFKR